MSKYAPHRQSGNNPRATSTTVCQRCLGTGHFIFECKSTRPYVSRPSRTQQLAKVNTLDKLKLEGKPSVELPDEFRTKCVFKALTRVFYVLILFAAIRTGTANELLEAKEKERAKDKQGESSKSRKRRRRCVYPVFQRRNARNSRLSPGSLSASSSSGSESDSGSDSDSGSESDSSSSGSHSDSSSGSLRSRSRSRIRSPDRKRRRGRSVSSADSRDSRRRGMDRRRRYSSEDPSDNDRRRR
ncbi:hypothetical protein BDM02DRAFT_3242925 [Thelephora ganbajun]|uniref:Uncharacterized protein n=1 Tax=Thelephora ganbajun TaxID=370292 RepID=A0ACB6ZF23_THEGA|nr:hypothetical protein BDM02DRAFT_3242925 [Thelephora ganbajun]